MKYGLSLSIFAIFSALNSSILYASDTEEAANSQGADRPNILVIWGDDIGWSNLSSYNHAVMGYSTPNIDRIAEAGIMFTDHYAQPSADGSAEFADYTIWTSAADTNNVRYYYKTYLTQSVEVIDVKKAIEAIAEPTTLIMESGFVARDRTGDF